MQKSEYRDHSKLEIVTEKIKKVLKDKYKLILSLFIAIVLPWILTLIFVVVLGRTLGLSAELTEDAGLLFRIIIFYTFTLTHELPILGNGFWFCIVIWAIPGFLIGLIPRDEKVSLISAVIGLGTTFILYLFLVSLPYPSFPNDMIIDSLIFTRLYSEFSIATPYYLLFHILLYSFAFPVLILFTTLGFKVNPPPRKAPSEIVHRKIIPEKLEKYLAKIGEYMKSVNQSLKKNYKPIISVLIVILLPWILTLIFIVILNRTLGLSVELSEDAGLLFRIIIFYTFTLTYESPILGNGYWLCIVIWAVPGLYIGTILRDLKMSLISAVIGFCITFILYLFLVSLPYPSFPNDMIIDSLISTRLYSEFSISTPYYLLFHILLYSFAFPVLILFTLIGTRINPKPIKEEPIPKLEPEIQPVADAKVEPEIQPVADAKVEPEIKKKNMK